MSDLCVAVLCKCVKEEEETDIARKFSFRCFSFETKAVGFRPLTGETVFGIIPSIFLGIPLRVPLLFSD